MKMHVVIVPQEKKERGTTGFLYEEQVWVNPSDFNEREAFFWRPRRPAPDNPPVSHGYLINHDQKLLPELDERRYRNSWTNCTPEVSHSDPLNSKGALLLPATPTLFTASLLIRSQVTSGLSFASWRTRLFPAHFQDNRINPCYTHAAKYVKLFSFSLCFMWKENPEQKPRQGQI